MKEQAGNRPHVFVVEDDAYMQLMIQFCLAQHFTVTLHETPGSALAQMQTGVLPDLIVSDYSFGAESGLEFLLEIRQQPAWANIPFFILSGREDTDIRLSCLEAGADDFILKPFNLKELVARSRNILRRTGALLLPY